MPRPIGVIVVDDNARIRAAWEKLVRMQADMTLIDAMSEADGLAVLGAEVEAVVLLDLSMPGRDPLEMVAQLRETSPGCRVVVYSGHSDAETMESVLRAGAWGFVDKITPPAETLGVIRRVGAGEPVFAGTLGSVAADLRRW